MPTELERRLERALTGMPVEASSAAHDRARAAALAATPGPGIVRRSRWRAVAAVAIATALVTTGVTLAASGRSPFTGASTHARPAPQPPKPITGPLPQGALSFSTFAGGSAWVAVPHRFVLRGARRTAVAVGPNAVYVMQADGNVIQAVSMASGRVVRSRRTDGRVTAVVWSPYPIRIAYVTSAGGAYRLHDAYGDLSNDRLVDPHVGPIAPSWRWDSLAFAYVRADGRVAVHNVFSRRTFVIRPGCGIRRATAVAFSPTSGLLAITDRARLRIVDTTGGTPAVCTTHAGGAPSIVWIRPRQLLVGAGTTLSRYVLGRPGVAAYDTTATPGTIRGLAASPDSRRLALALGDGRSIEVVAADVPRFGEASTPLHVLQVLLRTSAGSGPVGLNWE
jgi:hypothetical protein